MIKRNAKRALSVILSIILTVTTFFIFDPSILKIDTGAYVSTSGTTLSYEEVFFYVPEVIYLTPSTAGATTPVAFKWFADRGNSDNSGITTNVSDKYTGNVYFHCSSATSFVINVAAPGGCSVNNVTLGSWINGSSYATDQMTGAAYNTQGQKITWTVTWKDSSGRSYTATRYSTIYKPNYVANGGAGRSKRSSWGKSGYMQGAVYINGFANNYTGGSYTVQDAYNTSLNPNWDRMGDHVGFTSYMWSTANGPMCYGDANEVNHTLSGLVLFLDRSRFSNYSQIPNLTYTVAVTDFERTDEKREGALCYDTTSASSSQPFYVPSNDLREQIYKGRINAGTPGASTSPSSHYFYGYFQGKYGGTGRTNVTINFSVYSYDKTSLRNAYDYAVKSSKYLQQNWYTDSAWSAYTTALNNVVNALEGVEDTNGSNYVNLANTLTNQVNTMKNAFTGAASKSGIVKSGTVTVHHKYVTGGSGTAITSTATVSSDETLTYYYGENVITGFKDLSSSPDRGYVNHGYATGNFSSGTLTLGTGNNTYTFVETPSLEYTYVYLKKSLVTFNANGGSCGTANKTVTYSYTYGDLPTPSRTGYTFKGWFTATSGGSQVTSSTTAWILADQTLYAQWTPNNYTVTFNANGGTCGTANKTVTYDSTYGTLPTATRTGYTFNGWFTATSGGSKVETSTVVKTASNHTLYAQWTPNIYKVTLNNMGATSAGTTAYWYKFNTVNNGVYYYLNAECTTAMNNYTITAPQKTGYTFNGYYTETNGAGTAYVNSAGTCINNLYQVVGDRTLYAYWTANNYTVTFNANGGSCGTANKTVTYDSTYGDLPTPARTGYTFTGWFTTETGGTKVETSTVVKTASNHTLFAHWSANTYTVTFNANTGVCDTASKTVTYDSTYGDLPTPARTGYTFTGWFTTETGGTKVETSTVVKTASNHTLFAHWSANTYTVYFNANSGVCDTASKTVTYDSAYGTLPTPTKTGYTFTGWFVATNSDVQVTSATVVNKAYDHTLYARWVVNDYTVTFNANGGTVSPESKTVTFDSAYGELPTPTRTGYTFGGWYNSETGGTQIVASTVVSTADNHSIYAHWIANELNVSFNPNGGTCTTTGKTVTYDSAYGDLPTASRTGYTFDGWATAASGGEKIESSTIVTIPTDHTLYAQWVANTYTVTFDANTGVCDTASKEVTYDSTYGELPVPTKTCYTFIGWFTQATGGDVVSKSTKVSITSDQTLYAHWVLAGHDYADEIVPPTCSAEGYTIHTCTRCGDTYIDSYVPVDQNAHSWVVKSIDSTTHTYECEYCHTTKTEEHIKDMDGNCLCDSEFTDGAYEVDIVIGGKVVCFKYMPTDETFDPSTFSVPVQYRESKYRVGHDTVLTPRADYQNPQDGDVITYDADFEYTDYADGTFDVTVVDKGVTTVTSYGWYEKATIKSSWANFLYWVDEYGNIVSTYKVYYFLTVKDTTLTAVYKSDVSDPSAEKAFIKTNFAENGDDDSLTFYSERCVNYSNYTLLSHGIVLAPSSKVGNDYNTLYNSLVCGSGNSSILVYDKAVPEGQSTAKCYGSFTVAVPQKYLAAHSLDNEVWYARAYVLVENKTTGEIEYHYGDIAEFDLSDPNATFTRRTDVKNDNLLIAAI